MKLLDYITALQSYQRKYGNIEVRRISFDRNIDNKMQLFEPNVAVDTFQYNLYEDVKSFKKLIPNEQFIVI